jgi:hypothetical protein
MPCVASWLIAPHRHRLLQAEVEQFYISSGFLIPIFHKAYWMGLVSNTTAWPRFSWTDRSQPRESPSLLMT